MKNYFEKLVKLDVFPGCNYAIIHDDKIEINSVGNKQIVPKIVKNDINTLYDLASLTKVVVTNVLITKLLQDNKIKLDDKVKKYLPKFKYENITIFHLLTHSSGLIADVNWNKVNNKEDLIELLYDKELYYETDKDVVYSDLNFIFLGFIIEKIYNDSIDKIAEKEIFLPLGMHNTSYRPVDKERCAPTEFTKQRGLVQGFVHDEKAYLLGPCGSAGVFSDIFDMVKFVKMVLNNGQIDGKQFIDEKYIQLWETAFVKGRKGNVRGLGWCVGKGNNMGTKCGDKAISHTGFTGNTLLIDRENNIAIIELGNRIHPSRENKLLIRKRKYMINYIYKNIEKI